MVDELPMQELTGLESSEELEAAVERVIADRRRLEQSCKEMEESNARKREALVKLEADHVQLEFERTEKQEELYELRRGMGNRTDLVNSHRQLAKRVEEKKKKYADELQRDKQLDTDIQRLREENKKLTQEVEDLEFDLQEEETELVVDELSSDSSQDFNPEKYVRFKRQALAEKRARKDGDGSK